MSVTNAIHVIPCKVPVLCLCRNQGNASAFCSCQSQVGSPPPASLGIGMPGLRAVLQLSGLEAPQGPALHSRAISESGPLASPLPLPWASLPQSTAPTTWPAVLRKMVVLCYRNQSVIEYSVVLTLLTPKLSGKRMPAEGILNINIICSSRNSLILESWESILRKNHYSVWPVIIHFCRHPVFKLLHIQRDGFFSLSQYWCSCGCSSAGGSPSTCCWSYGSAEIPYEREDEFQNLGLQLLCASLD